MLVIDSPQSHRLIMAAPALALLAALALVTLGNLIMAALQPAHTEADSFQPDRWRLSWASWRTPSGRAGLALLALVLLFTLNDLGFYYGRFPTNNQYADNNTEIAYEMANYLNELEGEWTAYLFGPPILFIDFPTLPYLLTDFQAGTNLFNVESPEAERAAAATPNQIFIFLPQREAELAAVESQYPGGQRSQVNGYYASPLFIVYELQE